MTAVVGILNKQAIAVAADSAVTISSPNGHRIFNKANKIFTISKRHPVGVMIYNSANFMNTPWETIIKVYRNQLQDKSYETLKKYTEDFIKFLHTNAFYTDPKAQKAILKNFISNVMISAIEDTSKEHPNLIKDRSIIDTKEFLSALEIKIEHLIQIWRKDKKNCNPEFTEYSFEDFKSYSIHVFEETKEILLSQYNLDIPSGLLKKMKKAVYNIIRAKEDISNYTGLIFIGFGEEEIYPQLIALNISIVLDNRLRYHVDNQGSVSISNKNNGAIRPFAQTDVIDTILAGIDPQLEESYIKNFAAIFEKYNQTILENLKDDSLLRKQIKNLGSETVINTLIDINNQVKKKNYIRPLMNAVSHLSKEDLAEMAESLVYLTFLKRRITFAEESVGGPIDVAIISKGDGFVWIRRKHYFNADLNPHFFDNYFKK